MSPGYKLRKHIAQALQARSQAIKSALERYNEAAKAFKPPRRTLSWEEVVEYAFLADFDLLRDSRQDIRDRPWAQPLNHVLMDQWFKRQCAREEIERLNIEIRRVVTHIRDERKSLEAAEQDALTAQPPDTILAFQIQRYREERDRFSALHLRRFKLLASVPGFTGSLAPGTSLDPTLRSRGQANHPSNAMDVDGEVQLSPGTVFNSQSKQSPPLSEEEGEESDEDEGEEDEEDEEARFQVVMAGTD